MRFSGKVIYTRSFDVEGDIDTRKIKERKGFRFIKIKPSGRHILPRYISPYPDLEVKLPPVRIYVEWEDGAESSYYVGLSAAIRKIGVITLLINIPFKQFNIDKLIDVSTLEEATIRVKGERLQFYEWVERIYKRVYQYIKNAIYNQYTAKVSAEDYTFVVIDKVIPKITARELLSKYQGMLAGILRGEPYWRGLSEQEKTDATASFVAYTNKDMTLISFDKAVLINTGEMTADILSVLNVANIQRLTLRVYEELLKQGVAEAKKAKVWSVWRAFYPATWTSLYEIGTLQLEIARLVEELKSEVAYSEDYFLGKIYHACSKRLRLDMQSEIVEKYINILQSYHKQAMDARATFASLLVEISFIIIMVILWLLIG